MFPHLHSRLLQVFAASQCILIEECFLGGFLIPNISSAMALHIITIKIFINHMNVHQRKFNKSQFRSRTTVLSASDANKWLKFFRLGYSSQNVCFAVDIS